MRSFFERTHLAKLAALAATFALVAVTLTTSAAGGEPFGADSYAAPDTTGVVGATPSMVLDENGYPAIAYYDTTNGALKLIRCSNADCSGSQMSWTLDTIGNVGTYPSLALNDAGNPVISYYDQTNSDLKLMHCTAADCTGISSTTTVDSVGSVGLYSSLALDADELPMISYYDATNGDLKYVKCTNVACTGAQTPVTVDSTGNVGVTTSMKLDADGLPVIAYQDNTNGDLRVLRCSNTGCTGAQTSQAPVTTGTVGFGAAMVLDSNGYPVISYYNSTGNTLGFVRCTNAVCSGVQTAQTPDTNTGVGSIESSVALNAFGYPVISYFDATNGDLRILQCTNEDCSGTQTPTSPDTVGTVGVYPDVHLDQYGNPVVAYFDATNNDLKVLHCYDVNGCGGQDQDMDGVMHADDNCAQVANENQLDVDGDGSGNACDEDDITLPEDCETPFGINIIRGDSGNNTLTGTSGPDIIIGFAGNDTIKGKGGDDCILGGKGDDIINAGAGDDVVKGQSGDDRIRGKKGRDLLMGNNGQDRIWGNKGADTILGNKKVDILRGGSGSDTINSGSGADFVYGGSGTDICRGKTKTDTQVSCEA